MADTVDQATRSRMMAGIRGSNTKLELLVRQALHKRGLRYRIGGRGLPGRPDIVFPRFKTVVFVHGCFWHGHDCHLYRVPKTRSNFWQAKVAANRLRDAKVIRELTTLGWHVFVVWECSLRGVSESSRGDLFEELAMRIRAGHRKNS